MILQAPTASAPARIFPTTRPARPARRPILTLACCSYLLIIIATWIFVREMGDRWWVATLLLILPRWPFLLPLVVLGPLVIAARKWWLRAVVAVAAVLVLTALMGFRVAMPISAPDRGDLRVMTFNVHRQHVDPDQLAQYLATVNPDVVAIQDWSEANHESLFPAGKWHVSREGELFVASLYQIGRVTPLDFSQVADAPKAERGAAACFELLAPNGPINLIDVHLASPHSGLLTIIGDQGRMLDENVQRRWSESQMVRDFVERTLEPVILAGDFNTTDESPIFREHWSDFTDAFSERGSGFGYTYLIDHTQLRIDHILTGPSCQPIRCWVGPEAGSPHRPLVGDFMLR